MNNKKTYIAPEVVVYGDVEKLTEQNGSSFVDVPEGTPAGTPGGVVGDPS